MRPWWAGRRSSLRRGGFLLPSLFAHGVLLTAITGVQAEAETTVVEMVEFAVITELGGGVLGNDSQVGSAPEPTKEPDVHFRRVRPKPKKAPAAVVEPSDKQDAQTEADAARDAHAAGAADKSVLSGSAGKSADGTGVGTGAGEEGVARRDALRAWLREIQREVNKLAARNYPRSAVRMGLEGRMRLGLTITTDGHISNVRVVSSSGHGVLDESAMASVMQIRVPPPPAELHWQQREISLPIRYSLQ